MDHPPDQSQSPWPFKFENGVTKWIVERRRFLFGCVILIHLLAFNGQWRIGIDSSVYRQLGHNLLEGRGYTYHGEPHSLSYPGLPVLAATFEYLFGKNPLPLVICIVAMGGLTLVVVYRLLMLSCPPWVAVTVTVFTGLSATFLSLTCEILTDIPFLLGVCLCLYALEQARHAASRSAWVLSGVYFVLGIFLCLVFRPTFWILVAALSGGCVLHIIRRPRWSVVGLAFMLLLLVTWNVIDPRANESGGGYSGTLRSAVHRIKHPEELCLFETFERAMPGGYFSQRPAPLLNTMSMLVLLASTCTLLPRRPVWSLLVLGIVGLTILAGATPRYYLMVQPLLIFAWLRAWTWFAIRAKTKHRDAVFVTGLLFFLIPNLMGCANVIKRQRAIPFVAHWDRGQVAEVPQLATILRTRTPPGAKILGPHPEALTFLSDRHVIAPTLFDRVDPPKRPMVLKEMGIEYAVLSADLYRNRFPEVAKLIEDGILQPVDSAPTARPLVARIRIDSSPSGAAPVTVSRREQAKADVRMNQ